MTDRVPEEGRRGEIDNGVVSALTTAARQLRQDRQGSEDETLSLIVSGAVGTVPGAEHAGVSLLRSDGSITSHTFSSQTVADVDQLQSDYREGPCVTALWDEHTVVVEDLRAESWRWPRFAPEAISRGVGSMLSFQLFAQSGSMGAMNLYSSEVRSFTAESRVLGGLFASHAAMALGEARHVAQLHEALATRDVIGQAKGILMERFDLGPDQAFRLLVSSSQQTNVKLVAVAQWLTENRGQQMEQD